MAKLKPNQLDLQGHLITEIPILFQTEMVQANLADMKTQTRRANKLDVPHDLVIDKVEFNTNDWPKTPLLFKKKVKEIGNTDFFEIVEAFKSPYGKPGDLLWVRESMTNIEARIIYKADLNDVEDFEEIHQVYGLTKIKWKPSIHMPKSASRLWLMVEEIRVERLQDITEEDAKAEGMKEVPSNNSGFKGNVFERPNYKRHYATAKLAFSQLWISINGQESWKSNPWVWVIKYRILSKTGRPSDEVILRNHLEITKKEVSNG